MVKTTIMQTLLSDYKLFILYKECHFLKLTLKDAVILL